MEMLKSFILHQVLPFIIGILLLAIIFISLIQGGFQFILAINNGLFMKWEQLSNFPTEPVDILTYHQGILVRDTTNTVYALKSFSSDLPEHERWVIDTRDLSKP